MLEIVNLDITLNHKTFSDIMDDVISDFTSNTGISFEWSDKEAHLSQSNLSMYKVSVKNNDAGNELDIVAEHKGNDIIFKPFELRNYNNSFYKFSYEDDELKQIMMSVLKKCALKGTGNFGGVDNGNFILIKDGKDISSHVKGIAMVDDRNNIYTLQAKDIQTDEDEDQDDVMGYVPKYLISDWLDENLQFKEKIQGMPKTEQFEIMAQYALFQRRKKAISANQFRDLIVQMGSLIETIGGFKDQSIKDIYELFN